MSGTTVAVRVWDLPTRVFHWVLAFCVVGSVSSAWIGGNAMAWHLRFGYAVMALLLFRLLWGFFGGRWSRFATFVYSPATSVRYLRGKSRPDELHDVGHSPLGAFSVFALLAVLTLQVASGLFADDEISTVGPLNKFVSAATAGSLTRWHTVIGEWAVIGLVALHIGAVLFYLVRHENNLLAPMLTGYKRLAAGIPGSADNLGTRLLALALFACAAGMATWLVTLGD